MRGARIVGVVLRRLNLRRPFPPDFDRRLTGRDRPQRWRGGANICSPTSRPVKRSSCTSGCRARFGCTTPDAAPEPHDHVVFALSSGVHVSFNDPRRFGVMDLVPNADARSSGRHSRRWVSNRCPPSSTARRWHARAPAGGRQSKSRSWIRKSSPALATSTRARPSAWRASRRDSRHRTSRPRLAGRARARMPWLPRSRPCCSGRSHGRLADATAAPRSGCTTVPASAARIADVREPSDASRKRDGRRITVQDARGPE